ncbi:MAG: hypothetical protein RLZZ440_1323 [Planctomycetota bacterium]
MPSLPFTTWNPTAMPRSPIALGLIALLLFAAARLPAAPPSAAARQAGDAVLALVAEGDADMQAVALERVRDGDSLAGAWFTTEAAARLAGLSPDRQARLLVALADRGDPAALPAVRPLAVAADERVKLAAIALLGRLGEPADVPLLVEAVSQDGAVAAAARRGLIEIRASDAVRAAASAAAPATQAVLFDILADRRDRQALPLLAAAADGDPAGRAAAMRALARFGTARELDAMVRSFLQATGGERKAAETAIVAVCTTGSDAPAAAATLVAGYGRLDPALQEQLLPVLARVGGPGVMAIVDGMVAEPATRRQGLEALARWPDASVTERILAVHAATADPVEKQLMLNALIRIAPLPDNRLDDAGRLALLEQTFALCDRPEDRGRVIERANAIRTYEAFRFVAGFLDDPALAEAACLSIVELAHHRKLRDAHKPEFMAALDRVLATSQNPELIERATRYKAGQTWDRKRKS